MPDEVRRHLKAVLGDTDRDHIIVLLSVHHGMHAEGRRPNVAEVETLERCFQRLLCRVVQLIAKLENLADLVLGKLPLQVWNVCVCVCVCMCVCVCVCARSR